MDPVTGAVTIVGLKTIGAPAASLTKEFLERPLTPVGDAIGKAIAHPVEDWYKRRVERAHKLEAISQMRTVAVTWIGSPSYSTAWT
jgi:hypothetical protein